MGFVLELLCRRLVYVIDCFIENLNCDASSIKQAEENLGNGFCDGLFRLIKRGYVLRQF